MKTLSDQGLEFVHDFARRRGIARDSAMMILEGVDGGNGTMAQFQIPEWGACQWMRGGMSMAGKMGNHELRTAVNEACSEMAARLAVGDVFEPRKTSSPRWWPDAWGEPSSSGSQDRMSYVVFRETGRLAVNDGGRVALYDTGGHRISGASQQQQGGDGSLSFRSQHGTVALSQFRRIPDDGEQLPSGAGPTAPIPELIGQLAGLRDAGVLTEAEFSRKKGELLDRL